MTKQATVEIYRAGKWWPAATIAPTDPEVGHNGDCRLEYCLDYSIEFIDELAAAAAGVSCRYPVDFNVHDESTWPAFLLDILPNGAGRVHWLKRLDIRDGHTADWPLLLHGAAFPPGNLRIKEAVEARKEDFDVPRADGDVVQLSKHPGFALGEIYERQEHFIEYAYQNGAQTAGSSDVQGVAPKFLMVQDAGGMWHAEGALTDSEVASHWLIKFPRDKGEADKQVLRVEAAYMTVANALGLKVHESLTWHKDTLLIPRFDRVVNADGRVTRIGMESLCSLAGIAKYGVEYGGSPSHNTLCEALVKYATEPEEALLEYIKRDVVNIALGNKDNHPRNTAVFRYENGRVELTPLFDFAPMYLDPAGIARACRWEGDQEKAGTPDWVKVIDAVSKGASKDGLKKQLAEFADVLEQLPQIMATAGVDVEIIENRKPAIELHSTQLRALG